MSLNFEQKDLLKKLDSGWVCRHLYEEAVSVLCVRVEGDYIKDREDFSIHDVRKLIKLGLVQMDDEGWVTQSQLRLF